MKLRNTSDLQGQVSGSASGGGKFLAAGTESVCKVRSSPGTMPVDFWPREMNKELLRGRCCWLGFLPVRSPQHNCTRTATPVPPWLHPSSAFQPPLRAVWELPVSQIKPNRSWTPPESSKSQKGSGQFSAEVCSVEEAVGRGEVQEGGTREEGRGEAAQKPLISQQEEPGWSPGEVRICVPKCLLLCVCETVCD